jgi:hypothetical protein
MAPAGLELDPEDLLVGILVSADEINLRIVIVCFVLVIGPKFRIVNEFKV